MNPHAFLSLEASFNAALMGEWRPRAEAHAIALAEQVEAGSYAGAGALAQASPMAGLTAGLGAKLDQIAQACLLFGASMLSPLRETGIYDGSIDTSEARLGALGHLRTIVEIEGSKAVQWDASQRAVGLLDDQLAPVSLFKEESISSLAAKLNAATLGTGKALIDIGANQTTSRLIAFGFLAQASKQGVTEYQISEVLDDRTCPVCRYMHGKIFRVAQEMSTLKQAFAAQDPADLKAIKPWPKQTKAALADLYTSDSRQMQANGLGSPPYHPNCRGILVPIGTVEEDIPTQPVYDPKKLQELFDAAKAKPTGATVVEPRTGRPVKTPPPPPPPPSPSAPVNPAPYVPEPIPAPLPYPDLIGKLPNAGLQMVARALLNAGNFTALNALLKKNNILP